MPKYVPPIRYEDPLTMAAKRLGEAKTKAEAQGNRLIETFNEIEKEIKVLAENGLALTTVSFKDKALDAAWRAVTTAEMTELPLMETERELITRIRSVG